MSSATHSPEASRHMACFIDPVDVLYIRGNRLFGGAGEHGEALMPPWPSLASGAVRSQLLVGCGASFKDFQCKHLALYSNDLHQALGTPHEPGEFRITWFSPARIKDGKVNPALPLPQDVFVADEKNEENEDIVAPEMLRPAPLPDGVQASSLLPKVPVLRRKRPAKPKSGQWLNAQGIAAWVQGEPLRGEHLIATNDLWRTDMRLGIAIDHASGTASEGQIYTSETVAMQPHFLNEDTGSGFLVGMAGITAEALRKYLDDSLLRFGGDGRAAAARLTDWQPPEPDWQAIEEARACRILLTTPGLFAQGWRLPGMGEDGTWHGPKGLKGKVVAAAVGRAQTISGWDLANWQPKPAERAAPTGSVYWLEALEGDIRAGLKALLEEGLWACLPDTDVNSQRRAEGYGNCLIGAPLKSDA
jgi:CRISPR-associated protein Cmr3